MIIFASGVPTLARQPVSVGHAAPAALGAHGKALKRHGKSIEKALESMEEAMKSIEKGIGKAWKKHRKSTGEH